MKLGILTYHRAENYGALLQAYALRTYLKRHVEKVEFVDYWPDYHREHYKVFSWKKLKKQNFKGKMSYLVYFFIFAAIKYQRKNKINKFLRRHLNLGSVITYKTDQDICKEFDIVVYGSDQIWRKQDVLSKIGYNPWYFGNANVEASRKISYAGSMGVIASDINEILLLKKNFVNFDVISVRELDLQKFLSDLGFDVRLVIDPVFLLNKKEWRKLTQVRKIASSERYILFYNLLNTPESNDFVNTLQVKMKLPVKEINMKLDFAHLGVKYIKSASVEKFLSLIDNAEFVVTNSFHGTAFSIIFEKQFYAVGLRDKSSRVCSLLELVGIRERYIEDITMPINDDNIDYVEVNTRLHEVVEYSKSFLIENIVDEEK